MPSKGQSLLKKALSRLEDQRDRISREIEVVRAALEAMESANPNLTGRRKRSPMGPAERRAVSRRMKAYWAKRKNN